MTHTRITTAGYMLRRVPLSTIHRIPEPPQACHVTALQSSTPKREARHPLHCTNGYAAREGTWAWSGTRNADGDRCEMT